MNCPTILGRVRARVLSNFLRVLSIGAAALVVAPACVTTPYDGKVVSVYGYFPVSGFAETPSASVVVQAYNYATGAWETIGTTTGDAQPSYAANYWLNSPALYWYTVSVRVADPNVPATMNRWSGGLGAKDARLRVRNVSSNQNLFAGEFGSLTCFSNNIAGNDFYATAHGCGFEHAEFHVSSI